MKEEQIKYNKFVHDIDSLLSNGIYLCQADRIAIKNMRYSHILKYKFKSRRAKLYSLIIRLMFKEDERMLIKMALDERINKLENAQDWKDMNYIRGFFTSSLWK